MAYPLTKCLHLTLIIGIVICVLQIISSVVVTIDFGAKKSDYEDYGSDMIKDALLGPELSHINETSAWRVAISEEYEMLSSFDKENVYCDVPAILGSPDEHLDAGTKEFEACIFLLMFAIGGCALIVGFLVCSKCDKFYDVDMVDIKASKNIKGTNIEDPTSRAVIADSHWKKKMSDAEKLAKNLSDFRSNTAYLFMTSGCFLALYWLLIERRSNVVGFDCQALVYSCGKSGECVMDDMMLTVPLNSSLLKMFLSYGIITWGILSCIVSLLFVLGSGVVVTCGSSVYGFLYLPVFMFFYSLLPFVWVYFIDDKIPLDNSGLVGIFAFLLLAFLGEIVWVCVFVCRSCKGITKSPGYR